MRKVYWWEPQKNYPPLPPNFGDALNASLLQYLDAESTWAPLDEAELVMVGSILDQLPARWSGTIAGAGLLNPGSKVDLSYARVLALRGKLTAQAVTGLPTHRPVVLGDPGLLAPRLVAQPGAHYDLGICPHYSDTELAKRYPSAHLIDVSRPVEQAILGIARCKRIITSSLHGAVVADAYGIPRQIELPRWGGGRDAVDFKYRDYASIYDTHPHFGEMWTAPHATVERIQNELASVLQVAVGRHTPPEPTPAPVTIRRRGCSPQISLLIPFRDDAEQRSRTWDWLDRYWWSHLRSAEIIVGSDSGTPFSKACAINAAAEKARGRIFAVLDADVYLDSQVVQNCADAIDAALKAQRRLWFMPYTRHYRIDHEASDKILWSDPSAPYAVSSPPPPSWIEPGTGGSEDYGHKYGAMAQIMPREAFRLAGGFDNRFRGWAGEDVSMMRALDTLYSPHENSDNDLLHLWHSRIGSAEQGQWRSRRWVGQTGVTNERLGERYQDATGDAGAMRSLVREHQHPRLGLLNKLFAS